MKSCDKLLHFILRELFCSKTQARSKRGDLLAKTVIYKIAIEELKSVWYNNVRTNTAYSVFAKSARTFVCSVVLSFSKKSHILRRIFWNAWRTMWVWLMSVGHFTIIYIKLFFSDYGIINTNPRKKSKTDFYVIPLKIKEI